jgi:hypothetical protein
LLQCLQWIWWPPLRMALVNCVPHQAATWDTHTTRNFINQKPKLVCNSEGTDGLPEDGTQLPKYVGAAKWNNNPIRIDAFVGYF